MSYQFKKPERNDSWEIIGPGGGGGQFRPTISPHDPNTVLIACDMTGAYITHDGGQTWREFNLGVGASAFYFDPVQPGIIYAGSNGLYRSEDNGATWGLLFPNPSAVTDVIMAGDHSSKTLVSTDLWPDAATITSILVDEKQTDHIYVGIHTHDAEESERTRIYFSRNNGADWDRLCNIEGSNILRMVLDPNSGLEERRLFIFAISGVYVVSVRDSYVAKLQLPEQAVPIRHASCGYDPASGQTVFYIACPAKWKEQTLYSGVWKSADLGDTWEPVQPLIDPSMAEPQNGHLPDFTLLAACETDARHVYLAVNQYPEIPQESGAGSIIPYWGFMRSRDAGATWDWVYKSDYNRTAANFEGGWVETHYTPSWNGIGPKGMAPLGLGVCGTDPEICYATDMGASYRTIDGGVHWDQVYSNEHSDGSVSTRGMDVTTCYGVHFDPFEPNHMVISYTDIGLFHSMDGGETWHHALNGISPAWGNTCYLLVFDPAMQGKAWGAWGYAHDLPRPKMFRSGQFYKHQGGVSKTDDGLKHWLKSNQGMPENCVTTHIVLDPASPAGMRTLYAVVFDQGVYKSTDDGATWVLKNEGISGNFNAWRIALLPDGTLFLLVARGLRKGEEVDGAVYKSVDGGDHWQKVGLPEGVNAPNDIVHDPQNPQRMYLACWPRTVGGEERCGGVYLTEDGGKTWESTFDPSSHVYGIAIDLDHPSTLFINTFDNAAYRTDDGGKRWKRLKGYNFKWGHSPFIDPYHKDRIYLTTFGSSVWRGPAVGDEDAFEDISPSFAHNQNREGS